MLDLVIRNGRIADGTGNPCVNGDIGIQGDRIVKLGKIEDESHQVIDAQGMIVSPGFIDMHSHSDITRFTDPLDEAKLQQGVTTEVVGNCGISPAPVSDRTVDLLKSYIRPIIGSMKHDWNWHSFDEYLDELSKRSFSCNMAPCIGSGSLRIAVKGFQKGPLNKDETAKVRHLLSESLKAGAMGFSMGLMYTPECYYSMEELTEICATAAEHGALLTTHIRGEGASLAKSVEEVVHIAEVTGISLNISHFKAAGYKQWGRTMDQAIEVIENARSRGIDVTWDVYPYAAGSTSLAALLPPWVQEGGITSIIRKLNDAQWREKIRRELSQEHEYWDNTLIDTGWDRVVVSAVSTDRNLCYIGKSLSEIAGLNGKDPADIVLDLVAEENGNVTVILHQMSDDDVKKAISWDKSIIASDSLYPDGGSPHPRVYGTFPRLFRKYVREDKILTLETAVKKVTSMPAERLGIEDRGLLKPGYVADIVIFDPDGIEDTATYENPRQYPKGIRYVIVGGKVTIESGRHTGVRKGCLLRKKSR